jgi:hypothetical protein
MSLLASEKTQILKHQSLNIPSTVIFITVILSDGSQRAPEDKKDHLYRTIFSQVKSPQEKQGQLSEWLRLATCQLCLSLSHCGSRWNHRARLSPVPGNSTHCPHLEFTLFACHPAPYMKDILAWFSSNMEFPATEHLERCQLASLKPACVLMPGLSLANHRHFPCESCRCMFLFDFINFCGTVCIKV